ncbi:helix-turn-helix domain-containing protein [Novispirillum itersonii]|uniref:Replication initiation protein RepC n=1 Tax=Novispirillum itersonii TaxID=189 RepID=A0A7X0DPB0_NOVIT|nr:helix-turn-helix domain-containing protein [Novispirillum itersonii]MBB6212164.1 replication initiation protein RepC [Novispirillum itersonii]
MGRSTTGGLLRRSGDGNRPPPTGHARKSYGHFDGAISAATFRGLPEGIQHPKQMLEPLRRCGSRLPFPREALATLELLFDYTKLSDWDQGGTPLVFPGNAELAGCLGVTERTVRNHLSALEQAGMISILRGPGNRRVPVWNGAGEIVVAYGINLAPVAEQIEHLKAVGQQLAERRRTMKRLMQQIGEALQDVRTAVDAVDVVLSDVGRRWEEDQTGIDLHAKLFEAEEKSRLARRLWERDAAASSDEQIGYEQALTVLRDELVELAGVANTEALIALQPDPSLNVDLPEINLNSGDPEIQFRDDSTKIPHQNSNLFQKEVVAGWERGVQGSGQPYLPGLSREADADSPVQTSLPVKATYILDLCPEFRAVLCDQLLIESPEAAPVSAYYDAARLIALRLGVSDWCWRTGNALHGRGQAMLAVAVALLRPAHTFTKNRQAFLAGMLLRPQGQLNALASFHALRKRRQEE